MRINTNEVLLTVLIALGISISVGVVLFGVLGAAPGVSWSLISLALGVIILISVGATLVFYFIFRAYALERVVKDAMMTLGEEERMVVGKIMELGGEVRQDDLWRKLDLSKSKLNELLINLEWKRAVTRMRYGRANILKLTEEFHKS